MLRSLAVAASLLAFSGLAAADCGGNHPTHKDALAPTDKVLASQAPTSKAVASTPKALDGSTRAAAQPAKAPAAPAAKERVVVASQCEGPSCK